MGTRTLPRDKWRPAGTGQRYDEHRWGAAQRSRRARLDPLAVAALLDDAGIRSGWVLDAACGTGRLRPSIETADGARRWIGVDASASMLGQGPRDGRSVLGDVHRLPFADRSFDAVVANRLLHHLRERDELERAIAELIRVSRGPVIASFWNRDSLPGLRARLGFGRDEGPSGRVDRSPREIERAARAAGARVVRVRHLLLRLSRQSFVVLLPRAD